MIMKDCLVARMVRRTTSRHGAENAVLTSRLVDALALLFVALLQAPSQATKPNLELKQPLLDLPYSPGNCPLKAFACMLFTIRVHLLARERRGNMHKTGCPQIQSTDGTLPSDPCTVVPSPAGLCGWSISSSHLPGPNGAKTCLLSLVLVTFLVLFFMLPGDPSHPIHRCQTPLAGGCGPALLPLLPF